MEWMLWMVCFLGVGCARARKRVRRVAGVAAAIVVAVAATRR